MCAPKAPKVKDPKVKDPAIIRNPFLDGIDKNMMALRMGRSALRIERGSGRGPVLPLPSASPGVGSISSGGGYSTGTYTGSGSHGGSGGGGGGISNGYVNRLV